MKEYPVEFLEEGSHGHCHQLLADAGLPDGVVLDLGCAAGRIAEPVTALGHDYVGADIDRVALDDLASRGFEAHEMDLTVGEDDLVAAIEGVLRGRPLAAVLMLDVLEHLVDPESTLRALARLTATHQGLQLVVSIPNVTHVDVGIKLLVGRWDVTDTGLLDDTHVRYFNDRLVRELMAGAGWVEVAVDDVILPFSDQLFPADAPALRPGAPLRQILWRVRMAADPYGETYQFVRRYDHNAAAAAEVRGEAVDRYEQDDVFLSVVVRAPVADAGSLDRLRVDLANQTCSDLEVLLSQNARHEASVTVPDGLEGGVRTIVTRSETDWRNAALASARGRYVAFLDHRTRLSPRYVDTIRRAAEALPGRVVQLGGVAAPVGGIVDEGEIDTIVERLEPIHLDPLDLVGITPLGSVALDAHAIPRQAWVANGLHFEANSDDVVTLFLLRAIELSGIVRSSEPVIVVHPSVLRDLTVDFEFLQKQLSLTPLVVPEGAGSQLLMMRQVVSRADELAQQLAAANDQITSLSWHLRHHGTELAQIREEAKWLRKAADRRLATRFRRRLGAVMRRI